MHYPTTYPQASAEGLSMRLHCLHGWSGNDAFAKPEAAMTSRHLCQDHMILHSLHHSLCRHQRLSWSSTSIVVKVTASMSHSTTRCCSAGPRRQVQQHTCNICVYICKQSTSIRIVYVWRQRKKEANQAWMDMHVFCTTAIHINSTLANIYSACRHSHTCQIATYYQLFCVCVYRVVSWGLWCCLTVWEEMESSVMLRAMPPCW